MKRALIVLALLAVLLLGGAYEHAFMVRSRLQLAADSAAEAGAAAAAAGRDVRQAAQARLALFPQLGPGVPVDVESPPLGGRYRGWRNAVRVRIHATWKPPLLPLSLPLDLATTALAAPLPGATSPSVVRVE